jgi:hypothetical protein
MANIAPIPKKGKRIFAKNYRPIALTSHTIKAFERIIRNVLQNFLETNDILNDMQHGFRTGRSCISQLIQHYDQIVDMLMDKNDVDVIYTDFAKAFDKCDHGIIAHKLKQVGITGKLGRWIYNFLKNRKQKVIVNGTPSSETNVPSSVPQGTVLAPILFVLFINDLGESVENSLLGSFADDTKLSHKLNNKDDHEEIQNDCNNLFKWAEENNAEFNSEKFQLLRYGTNTKGRNELLYKTPDGQIIEEVKHAKDLGIKMSNDATFEEHNIDMINKCKRLSSYILRTFKSRDKTVLLRLWKVLVIPIIEYCSILTSPYQIGMISKIEGLQRSFTSKIDLPPEENRNYYDRLKHLGIYSLQRRRERYAIMYTWKILEGIVPNLQDNKIVIKNNYHNNSRRGRKCRVPNYKNNSAKSKHKSLFDNSICVRGPKLFNKLPNYLRDITGVPFKHFKREVDKWLSSGLIVDEPPVSGYPGGIRNSLIDRVTDHFPANDASDGPALDAIPPTTIG